MEIPIQNIYFLLCYAWNKLDESEIINVRASDTTELVDLFAKVLINCLSHLLKQGLDRYYIEYEATISGIKGKLNLTSTIKNNLLFLQKTRCSYDEFDYDILHNQILKTTVRNLLKFKHIDSGLKSDLHKLYIKLPAISEIRIRNSHFNQIRLHRNNYYYDFVLKVCQIIHDNLLMDESTGNYKFKDFVRDEKQMNKLFQAFVRNFYHLEQSDFIVSSDKIKWKLTSDDEANLYLLPEMRTDISLTSHSRKIIIDTKFYKKAFTTYYGKRSINSNHLYQLYSYLGNQESDLPITKKCEGILLYPSVGNDFNYSYKLDDHKINVMSLNLNQDWKNIRQDLLNIISVN